MTLRYNRRYLPVGLEAAKKEKRREEKMEIEDSAPNLNDSYDDMTQLNNKVK